MPIKMSMTCSRCRREDSHEIESVAMATAFEELQKRKGATLEKLKAFIATLPPDELPDFFAIMNGASVTHSYLCDPGEGGAEEAKKRSCARRVAELMEGVNELGPRKPKAKKEKPAA